MAAKGRRKSGERTVKCGERVDASTNRLLDAKFSLGRSTALRQLERQIATRRQYTARTIRTWISPVVRQTSARTGPFAIQSPGTHTHRPRLARGPSH